MVPHLFQLVQKITFVLHGGFWSTVVFLWKVQPARGPEGAMSILHVNERPEQCRV